MHRALSIAGSDCSGGAGIQADIKAFSACGVYAQSAIVALVDENTQGVYGIYPVPAEFVRAQIRTCLDDIGTDAIKIGMLHSVELVRAVKMEVEGLPNIVLDPVMVSTSGQRLLEEDAISVLRDELLPEATVITPNFPEAEILLGRKIDPCDVQTAAKDLSILSHGASVLLKGGHVPGEIIDVWYNGSTDETHLLKSPRINSRNTHGTGCTLSSALAAYIARGLPLDRAAWAAKNYVSGALAAAENLEIGKGHGPVHHFYRQWDC